MREDRVAEAHIETLIVGRIARQVARGIYAIVEKYRVLHAISFTIFGPLERMRRVSLVVLNMSCMMWIRMRMFQCWYCSRFVVSGAPGV